MLADEHVFQLGAALVASVVGVYSLTWLWMFAKGLLR